MVKHNSRQATVYTRAESIAIGNPLNGTPKIMFFLQEVEIDADGNESVLGTQGTRLQKTMEDATVSFNVLNPADNSVIGTATFGGLQALLYSLYFHLADEEANPPVVSEGEPTDPVEPPAD